jgi:hypothetical protein
MKGVVVGFVLAVALLTAAACTGDDDGDGRADSTTTAADSDTTTTTSVSSTTSTSDAEATTTVPCENPPAPPADDGSGEARVLGRADVGGAPGDELFAVVGSGASVTLVGVFGLEGCVVHRLTGPDGGPATFAIGGTVTHVDGLRCDEATLVVLSATSTDGVTFQARAQRLLLDTAGRLMRIGAAEEETITSADPALAAYAALSCPGVESP